MRKPIAWAIKIPTEKKNSQTAYLETGETITVHSKIQAHPFKPFSSVSVAEVRPASHDSRGMLAL